MGAPPTSKPCWVLVNECGIYCQPPTIGECWARFRARLERCAQSDRLTLLAVGIQGDRVAIRCDDKEDADGLIAMLAGWGIPAAFFKATRKEPVTAFQEAISGH